MKRIITACGSGVATSQTVASKLKRLLDERKIKAQIEAVDIKSLDQFIRNADIYVTLTPNKKEDYGIPVFNGIAFLTGIGMQEELEKIIKEIQK